MPKITKAFTNSATPGQSTRCHRHKPHPLGLEPMRTRPGLRRLIGSTPRSGASENTGLAWESSLQGSSELSRVQMCRGCTPDRQHLLDSSQLPTGRSSYCPQFTYERSTEELRISLLYQPGAVQGRGGVWRVGREGRARIRSRAVSLQSLYRITTGLGPSSHQEMAASELLDTAVPAGNLPRTFPLSQPMNFHSRLIH